MPQMVIPIVENEIYHVFNRGVDKRDVFLDKEDYLRFYQSLNLFNSEEAIINFNTAQIGSKNGKESKDCLVEILAYSLLPNHYHLLIRSLRDQGLSEFMRRMSSGYTSYFNQKYERTGALFQGPFKRVHVETEEQYNYLFAYVNENHTVHNLMRDNEICYTSSFHYQNQAKSKLIKQILEAPYQLEENTLLANDIFKRRQKLKLEKVLFE